MPLSSWVPSVPLPVTGTLAFCSGIKQAQEGAARKGTLHGELDATSWR